MSVRIPLSVFAEFISLIDRKIHNVQSSLDGQVAVALQALEEIKCRAEEFSSTENHEDDTNNTERSSSPVREIEQSQPRISQNVIDTAADGSSPGQQSATVVTRRRRVKRKISQVCTFLLVCQILLLDALYWKFLNWLEPIAFSHSLFSLFVLCFFHSYVSLFSFSLQSLSFVSLFSSFLPSFFLFCFRFFLDFWEFVFADFELDNQNSEEKSIKKAWMNEYISK